MASATPDIRLLSQLQDITAHWLVPNYTAWWQRHMCVNNLPRVALDSGAAGIEPATCLSQVLHPTATPPSHRTTTLPRQQITNRKRIASILNNNNTDCLPAMYSQHERPACPHWGHTQSDEADQTPTHDSKWLALHCLMCNTHSAS